MASYTTNLNLKKPAGSENVAIGDINNNMDAIDAAYGTLNSKFRYFTGFESCTFTLANQAFATGINTINVSFDHELSNTPSFILCMMPQTSVWFVSAYSLSKTGATVRMYAESAFTATSLVIRCLTVY